MEKRRSKKPLRPKQIRRTFVVSLKVYRQHSLMYSVRSNLRSRFDPCYSLKPGQRCRREESFQGNNLMKDTASRGH